MVICSSWSASPLCVFCFLPLQVICLVWPSYLSLSSVFHVSRVCFDFFPCFSFIFVFFSLLSVFIDFHSSLSSVFHVSRFRLYYSFPVFSHVRHFLFVVIINWFSCCFLSVRLLFPIFPVFCSHSPLFSRFLVPVLSSLIFLIICFCLYSSFIFQFPFTASRLSFSLLIFLNYLSFVFIYHSFSSLSLTASFASVFLFPVPSFRYSFFFLHSSCRTHPLSPLPFHSSIFFVSLSKHLRRFSITEKTEVVSSYFLSLSRFLLQIASFPFISCLHLIYFL